MPWEESAITSCEDQNLVALLQAFACSIVPSGTLHQFAFVDCAVHIVILLLPRQEFTHAVMISRITHVASAVKAAFLQACVSTFLRDVDNCDRVCVLMQVLTLMCELALSLQQSADLKVAIGTRKAATVIAVGAATVLAASSG